MHTKLFLLTSLVVWIVLAFCGIGSAGAPFGSPETVAIREGGLYTAFGYWYHEDKYENGTEHVLRQNQLYSELGYGFMNGFEIYGRIGIADMKIRDAFSPSDNSTTTAGNEFNDNWQFSGTLGAKGFYPYNGFFGIGSFIQGTCCLSDYTDSIPGTLNGAPFTSTMKVKNPWDINFGIDLQTRLPSGTKLYIGPYIYYAQAKVSSSPNIPGINLSATDTTLKNKINVGGFAGVDFPIGKGFHLNLEGQYAERFSAGVAVTLVY
ncbi:MAG: hypothetical protein PHP23_04055 [Desulfobacterales bacterium]|nr:hypothetical protein [Desulfobacterales bacterium]MDD4071504.1 hypothetical protein [Desulfobacterales bacterium]MDD4392945.1 hypothetical protein [Desulfobacterales bacterium]